MIYLLGQGQYEVFVLLIIAIVLSLSFHEFGHAYVAKINGDNTAQAEGRLTLNPWAHIDVLGLLMVIFVGFGYAKPVPTDPRNFRSRYAAFWVAGAGPAMNLILAFLAVNTWAYLKATGQMNAGMEVFLLILSQINLLLMLFNLIPIGPLDGHYMLPYLLPREAAVRYQIWNARYGAAALLGLIALSLLGIPIFSYLLRFAETLLGYLLVF